MPDILARDQQDTVSPELLAMREELRERAMKHIARFALGDLAVEVCQGRDSIWCLVRRKGRGGLALRAAWVGSTGFTCRKAETEPGETLRLTVDSALGRQRICFATTTAGLHRLRATGGSQMH